MLVFCSFVSGRVSKEFMGRSGVGGYEGAGGGGIPIRWGGLVVISMML